MALAPLARCWASPRPPSPGRTAPAPAAPSPFPICRRRNVLRHRGRRPAAQPHTFAPWALELQELELTVSSSAATGLSTAEAARRLADLGPNELTTRPPSTSLAERLASQFADPLVQILLAAAALSGGLAISGGDGGAGGEEVTETIAIVTILALNALVGIVQEGNAEAALDALRDLQVPTARVLRGGTWQGECPARDLVQGDVLELRPGDAVPADCRVVALSTASLRAEQASLTGESNAVYKTSAAVGDSSADITSQSCMLFSGTHVVGGRCTALVTATGMHTQVGKIQGAIVEASKERRATPLQESLQDFGRVLTYLVGGICVAVWAAHAPSFVAISEGAVEVDWEQWCAPAIERPDAY